MEALALDAISNGLSNITRPERNSSVTPARGDGFGTTFRDLLGNVLETSETKQNEATQITESFAKGESQDLHRVMTALNEADVSFRLVLEVRNKLVDAWQEIKRMPI